MNHILGNNIYDLFLFGIFVAIQIIAFFLAKDKPTLTLKIFSTVGLCLIFFNDKLLLLSGLLKLNRGAPIVAAATDLIKDLRFISCKLIKGIGFLPKFSFKLILN